MLKIQTILYLSINNLAFGPKAVVYVEIPEGAWNVFIHLVLLLVVEYLNPVDLVLVPADLGPGLVPADPDLGLKTRPLNLISFCLVRVKCS
jgi:hypothetical protein